MGPLSGIKIIEVAGIGPGPYAAMMLADMGADVIRIDRSAAVQGGDPEVPPADIFNRGRRSIGIDLKAPPMHSSRGSGRGSPSASASAPTSASSATRSSCSAA